MTTSPLMARRQIASLAGLQFDGKRDIYEAAGYQRAPTFNGYMERYLRQGMARRIIASPARETWRLPPRILDGRSTKDAVQGSAFVKAWEELVSGMTLADIEADDRGVLYHLLDIDITSGIGQYGVLFLGFADGVDDFTVPLSQGSAATLAYMEAYNEGNARILTWETDPASPRYGMPVTYRLTTENGNQVDAHWTRVLHVASEADGRVYGTPRLQAVLNDLDDLLKITSANGEAAFRILLPAFFVLLREGYELSGEDEATAEAIDDFLMNGRRVLELEGSDVQPWSGEVVDPGPAADLVATMISAATNIPKRLLTGSERGELASSQDESNWSKFIASRQEHVATPTILIPFIKRMIFAGVLPMPTSGAVTIEWPELVGKDEAVLAQNGKLFAEFVNAVGVQIENIQEIATTFWPAVDPESIRRELEELPAPATMMGDPKEAPEGKAADEPYP